MLLILKSELRDNICNILPYLYPKKGEKENKLYHKQQMPIKL